MDTLLELVANLFEGGFPHGAAQRVPQEVPFVNHRFPLQISFSRKSDRRLRRNAVGLWLWMPSTLAGSFDYLVWLVTKRLCHSLVALLHFIA